VPAEEIEQVLAICRAAGIDFSSLTKMLNGLKWCRLSIKRLGRRKRTTKYQCLGETSLPNSNAWLRCVMMTNLRDLPASNKWMSIEPLSFDIAPPVCW
jgi:hypothetical protein